MKSLVAVAVGIALLTCPAASRADDVAAHGPRAGDPGWRVELDPDTGIYTTPSDTPPAPGTTSRASGARAAAPRVLTPRATAAGGYRIPLDDASAAEQH